jgi:hypothetical protein
MSLTRVELGLRVSCEVDFVSGSKRARLAVTNSNKALQYRPGHCSGSDILRSHIGHSRCDVTLGRSVCRADDGECL